MIKTTRPDTWHKNQDAPNTHLREGVTDLRTDGQTIGRMDGQPHPLIDASKRKKKKKNEKRLKKKNHMEKK